MEKQNSKIYIVATGKTYEIGGEDILGAFKSLKKAIEKGNEYLGDMLLSEEKLCVSVHGYTDYYVYVEEVEFDETD